MDDYVLLEDIGRRVNEWGREIVRRDYGSSLPSRGGSSREIGLRQGKAHRGRMSRKKRDVLRSQLDLRDIEVDLLPVGMQRQMLNHSTWNPK
jgi:hypothetical protein